MGREWEVWGTVLRCVDGDTFDMDLDLGFGIWLQRRRLRLAHADTPERGSVEGKEAKEYVRSLIEGKTLRVRSHSLDKYGRVLGSVVLDDGRSLADVLISEGKAKPYEGGRRT